MRPIYLMCMTQYSMVNRIRGIKFSNEGDDRNGTSKSNLKLCFHSLIVIDDNQFLDCG